MVEVGKLAHHQMVSWNHMVLEERRGPAAWYFVEEGQVVVVAQRRKVLLLSMTHWELVAQLLPIASLQVGEILD
jgi:hypothetical protein